MTREDNRDPSPGTPPRPPVPRRSRHARHRPQPLCPGRRAADRQPARPYRSALVRHRRTLDRRDQPVAGARPLSVPDALFAGPVARRAGHPVQSGRPATDPRAAWRVLADHYHLFRGTPSRLWLDHVFAEVFGLDVALESSTADLYFDAIGAALATPAFRPRALSTGSASTSSPPPRVRRTIWTRITPSRPRAGRDASSPPIARTA